MSTPEQWLVFGVFTLLAALVLLGAAVAGSGRLGELPDAVADQFVPAPKPELHPDDLRAAQFGHAWRGYSPAQVDQLLRQAAEHWDAERSPWSQPAPTPGGASDGP